MSETPTIPDQPPASVVDLVGNNFSLGKEIARGGQGAVYRVAQDQDLALKITFNKADNAAERVYMLPLPEGLHICTPLSILNDRRGYVMRLLRDMVPVQNFLTPRSKRAEKAPIPLHLAEMEENAARILMAYADGGGIRKRLSLLAGAAAALARLHAAGMYYGDISPANVFCSPAPGDNLVWWIDPDNIAFDSPVHRHASYYTPGFGAPEVISGTGRSCGRTDEFSFAVLAHYVLTLYHPFMGAAVEDNGGWEDEDTGDSGEQKAYRGEYPWIFDTHDDSNSTDAVLTPGLVMGSDVFRCLGRTFGPGRTEPRQRTGMAEFAEALARAADATLECPVCGMSWLPETVGDNGEPLSAGEKCPYCAHHAAPHLCIRSYTIRKNGTVRPLGIWRRELKNGSETTLPHRMLHPFSPLHHEDTAASISVDRGRLDILFDSDTCAGKLWKEDGDGRCEMHLHTDYSLRELAQYEAPLRRLYDGEIPVLMEIQYRKEAES